MRSKPPEVQKFWPAHGKRFGIFGPAGPAEAALWAKTGSSLQVFAPEPGPNLRSGTNQGHERMQQPPTDPASNAEQGPQAPGPWTSTRAYLCGNNDKQRSTTSINVPTGRKGPGFDKPSCSLQTPSVPHHIHVGIFTLGRPRTSPPTSLFNNFFEGP